ncbi:oxidoreductase, aldo/keto reductase family protein [Neobacillus bataviensis LMG 21833]|uniref:Oxidoreductase, aldo/keto reductase family protein n=1 Tax=Neobacillus bataviensis LMG 21833 TaxID=1117379 RepID=K6CJY4_9BACI|nr:aldo/keto reductase [Neobacillus bataviensis]EKN71470.1 oxidoreductase, aldo/keto reductase family protein [Neobacillus bataviensis LMG 21833]
MKYTTLKNTELKVSEIGLGTNAVGGHNLFQNVNEADGVDLVREALNNGVNLIDTADIYGLGRSEELVGEVLKEFKRDDFVIATKGAQHWFEDGSVKSDNRPEYLREAVEKSLQRLQLDYVDLYYLHFPDNETPFAESIGELARLKEEGKIRAIGISNVSIEQLKEANAHGDISVLQSPFNMLDVSAQAELLPYCVENNISFIPYGPLAFGLLGGGFTKDSKLNSQDWRNSLPLFQGEQFHQTLKVVDKLKEIATQKETSLPNLALAWLLAQEGVDAVIPGGKRKERILENIHASEIILSKEELNSINDILSNN